MALKAGYKGIKNNLLNKLKAMPFISDIGDGLILENGKLSATGGGGGSDLSIIAPAFSAETAYTAGEYVTYESKLYKFTTDHVAGVWDVSDVTEVTVSDDLEKTYKTDDATESAIVDADYIPFYDSSASASKKSTWNNFCTKIAAKFATVFNEYLGISSIGAGLTINNGVLSASAVGVNYSTSEQNTGIKWVDGKDVYTKTVLFPSTIIASAANLWVLTGITDATIENIIDAKLLNDTGSDVFRYYPGIVTIGANDELEFMHFRNTSNIGFLGFIIYYTKKTL